MEVEDKEQIEEKSSTVNSSATEAKELKKETDTESDTEDESSSSSDSDSSSDEEEGGLSSEQKVNEAEDQGNASEVREAYRRPCCAGIERNTKCCRRLDNQRGTNGTRRLRAR